jgi:hypothetical protein
MASGSADWTSWGLFGTNSADASRPYQGSQIQLNIRRDLVESTRPNFAIISAEFRRLA